jgi:hypothetical protein
VPISSPRILSISPFPPLHIVPPGRRISSPDFRLPAANRARFRRPQWARDTLSPSNLSGFLRCYSLTLFTCLNRHRSAHSTVTRSHRAPAAFLASPWKRISTQTLHATSPRSPAPRPVITVEQNSPEHRRSTPPARPRRRTSPEP